MRISIKVAICKHRPWQMYTVYDSCDDGDDNDNEDEVSLEVCAPNAATALPDQKLTSSVTVIGRECIPQSRFLDTPHFTDPCRKTVLDVQKTCGTILQ